MNKIRVIDLLNKIAKGEEVPKKIKYRGIIYTFVNKNTIQGSYDYDSSTGYLIENITKQLYLSDTVNTEIEIIEEEKEIEELSFITKYDDYTEALNYSALEDKINELVREVNKLKDKSE